MGKQWKQWLTLFLGALKLLQMVTAAMKLKDTGSMEEKLPLGGDSGILITFSSILIYIPVLSLRLEDKDH